MATRHQRIPSPLHITFMQFHSCRPPSKINSGLHFTASRVYCEVRRKCVLYKMALLSRSPTGETHSAGRVFGAHVKMLTTTRPLLYPSSVLAVTKDNPWPNAEKSNRIPAPSRFFRPRNVDSLHCASRKSKKQYNFEPNKLALEFQIHGGLLRAAIKAPDAVRGYSK